MSTPIRKQMVDQAYASEMLLASLAQATPLTDRRESDPAIQRFLGEFVAQRLAELNCHDIRRDRFGSVAATLPRRGATGQGSVLFVVYAMTHPAGTMEDAFTPRIVDGASFGIGGPVARGRAACEQRGSLASLFAALQALRRLACDHAEVQILALASGETGTHDAAELAVRDLGVRADGAILAVCSDMDVTIAHKGRVDVHIVVEGRAAHSSAPDLGINAVAGARWALNRIDEMSLPAPHPVLGKATLAVTRMLTEPVAAHTLPARCRIDLDVRLLPGEDPDERVAALAAHLAGVPAGQISVNAGAQMLPCEVSPDSALVRSILGASHAATGRTPRLRAMPAASDAGFFTAKGITTVCYGAGAVARAHTDEDVVAIDDVVEIAAVYAELMRTGVKHDAH